MHTSGVHCVCCRYIVRNDDDADVPPVGHADGSPTFTHSQPIKALAAKAMANAATFMQSGWVETACGVAGVQVWRKAASEFYEGYVPPFRSKGMVRGVSPALLMTSSGARDAARIRSQHGGLEPRDRTEPPAREV